jgi:hypothetical protein
MATIYKATTGTDLCAGASWVGGVVPTSADIAVIDSTVPTALLPTLFLSTTLNVQTLNVLSTTANVIIAGPGTLQCNSVAPTDSIKFTGTGGTTLTFTCPVNFLPANNQSGYVKPFYNKVIFSGSVGAPQGEMRVQDYGDVYLAGSFTGYGLRTSFGPLHLVGLTHSLNGGGQQLVLGSTSTTLHYDTSGSYSLGGGYVYCAGSIQSNIYYNEDSIHPYLFRTVGVPGNTGVSNVYAYVSANKKAFLNGGIYLPSTGATFRFASFANSSAEVDVISGAGVLSVEGEETSDVITTKANTTTGIPRVKSGLLRVNPTSSFSQPINITYDDLNSKFGILHVTGAFPTLASVNNPAKVNPTSNGAVAVEKNIDENIDWNANNYQVYLSSARDLIFYGNINPATVSGIRTYRFAGVRGAKFEYGLPLTGVGYDIEIGGRSRAEQVVIQDPIESTGKVLITGGSAVMDNPMTFASASHVQLGSPSYYTGISQLKCISTQPVVAKLKKIVATRNGQYIQIGEDIDAFVIGGTVEVQTLSLNQTMIVVLKPSIFNKKGRYMIINLESINAGTIANLSVDASATGFTASNLTYRIGYGRLRSGAWPDAITVDLS